MGKGGKGKAEEDFQIVKSIGCESSTTLNPPLLSTYTLSGGRIPPS